MILLNKKVCTRRIWVLIIGFTGNIAERLRCPEDPVRGSRESLGYGILKQYHNHRMTNGQRVLHTLAPAKHFVKPRNARHKFR